MYHAFVRRKITDNFETLEHANVMASLDGFAADMKHTFAGSNALGGSRHTRAGMKSWFERVYRLFPDMRFKVDGVVVSGFPWNTIAFVEWRSSANTATGESYSNSGLHVINLKLGKIQSMRVYLDTKLVDDVLASMELKGCHEAGAAPIND